MSRFFRHAASLLTMIGYVLVITWGPVWHDHQHCHDPALCEGEECRVEAVAGHSHSCLHSHGHAHCGGHSHAEADCESPSAPCHSPLHDDDCPVCQVLAHPPLAAPKIQVVDVSVPVAGFVVASAPLAERILPALYDSRGPPLV